LGFLDFLGSIGDIFGEIASIISQIFAFLWTFMYNALLFIWNTLVKTVGSIVNAFQKAQALFSRLWNDYIKLALSKIWDWIKLLVTHPIQAIQQLLAWIQKIRAWYNTHILPILKRQIQMIQKIRQFLAILRIFHVKWAQKLDNYLQDLEARIGQSVAIVLGTLNSIITWIALITDPSMLIRRNTLGAWLLSQVGLLKRVSGYGDNRPLTLDEQNRISKGKGMYYTSTVDAHAHALLTTGLTADDLARQKAIRAALVDATGQPLPS
jgi:hypothetical protein